MFSAPKRIRDCESRVRAFELHTRFSRNSDILCEKTAPRKKIVDVRMEKKTSKPMESVTIGNLNLN